MSAQRIDLPSVANYRNRFCANACSVTTARTCERAREDNTGQDGHQKREASHGAERPLTPNTGFKTEEAATTMSRNASRERLRAQPSPLAPSSLHAGASPERR